MRIQFADVVIDRRQRTLTRGGLPVELNARYFDALALLAGAPGDLVTKDRFLSEVWRGVPVTDEALTQCIRTLRRQLGDDATAPRFIETVPKHGYRFIAAVHSDDVAETPAVAAGGADASDPAWLRFISLGTMGMAGGGFAGLLGGIVYGFVASAQPGPGAASALLVLLCLTVVIALVGAAGVSFGIAAAEFAPDRRWFWRVLGGAAGGLVVGAVVKLLGTDAFNLLFGAAPVSMTGGGEGLSLGTATGIACWLALRGDSGRPIAPRVGPAALIGAAAGGTIPLLGGQLLSGSLDGLARQFPASRLRLDPVGALFGEQGLGPMSQCVSGAMEGALFVGCIAGAMALAVRSERRG